MSSAAHSNVVELPSRAYSRSSVLETYIRELESSYQRVKSLEKLVYCNDSTHMHIGMGGRALVEQDYMKERMRFLLILTSVDYDEVKQGLEDEYYDYCRDEILNAYSSRFIEKNCRGEVPKVDPMTAGRIPQEIPELPFDFYLETESSGWYEETLPVRLTLMEDYAYNV